MFAAFCKSMLVLLVCFVLIPNTYTLEIYLVLAGTPVINVCLVFKVILAGGSTRIPRIKQLVQEYFGGKEIFQSIDPDSVLSHGAAMQVV